MTKWTLVISLPGQPMQQRIECETKEIARTLVTQGLSAGSIECPKIGNREAFFQTGPGTTYLILPTAELEKMISDARAQQASSLIVPGARG